MALNLRTHYTVKTAVKNKFFMNLIGENFPVRPPLYKNLFSLKYDTGSCFLKSMRNLVRLTWEISVLTRGFLLYPGNLRPYFYFYFYF